MSDENVGGLVELPKPIRAMVRFTALQHIERDVYTAEQLHAYADARVEAALSAHGQPEPRVSQAMLDSQLETARLLDDLEKRSEARREKYGLHGQPVDYSPALHSVLSYIAYGECDEEGLHPGLFATVKEKIDKLRSKPVVDEVWLRQAIEEFKYLSGRTDLPMQDRERWRALNAALGATP